MAKIRVIDEELQNLNQAWSGTDQNGEWGYDKRRVEDRIKASFSDHETKLGQKMSGLRVNNQLQSKDVNGVVDITLPVVDQSLSEESSNAVQNAAVAHEINSIKGNTIDSIRTDPVEGDSSQLDLVFTNEQGTDFASVRIPAASEVGTVTFPRVTTELLTPARVKLGDSISMRWTYDHIIQEDGVQSSSGTAAQTVTIRALIGATEVYSVTKPSVAAGTTEVLTLGPDVITQAGTVNIYVIAQTVYGEDPQRAQGFKSVSVITMDLATSFDPASALALSNGFVDGQTITIPYTYTVPAGTTIYIYKDGVQFDTATVSGTARGNVYLTAADLTAGRHNIQLVAVSSGLLSNVVSIDLLKAGSSNNYLGFRMSVPVAQLSDMPLPYSYGNEAIPLAAEQFGSLSLDYAVWQSDSLEANVVVAVDGVTTQTLSADRTMQTLNQRFDESGTHALTITVGSVTRTFAVVVSASAGVTETEPVGYRNKLTANGRTNSESLATRSDWGGITTLTGVDFRTNGWNTDAQGVTAMLLTNGARSVHEIYPFVLDETDNDYSIQNQGMTFLMDIKVSQVMERGATIVSCLWDNGGEGYPMGIKVTTEEAGLYFGGVESIKTAEKVTDANGNYLDANGNIVSSSSQAADLYITRPHGVVTNMARDIWMHLAFVVQPVRNGYGLAMLFVNGKLSRANRYNGSLRQNVPQAITVDSDKADVRIRSMYYFRTPLTADEIVALQILTRPTAAEIQAAHEANAVGDNNNTADSDGNIAINRDTLRSKGRGTLTIIRSGDSGNGLTDLFACVDKKQDFLADYVRWDPPLDANGNPIGQGFEAYNVVIRIQGTSSVKYPYKNIRIYITKAYGTMTRILVVGGVNVTDTAKGYAMRGPGNSIEQSVICAKTDFVDSSLAGNTGGAHLFDDTMRALGLLTPPQEYDARVRQSVDGLPCDIFCGTSMSGALAYCGQFVLNNEKSKSGTIFGMEGVKDGEGNPVNWPCAFALEALDNNSPMTLFQPAGSAGSTALRNQLAAAFDNGFEFNFPEDAKWANVNEGQWDSAKGKWSVKPVDGSFTDASNNTWVGARGAVERLMGWIYDCVPAATRSNPDYGTPAGWSATSKAKWVSAKFKSEVSQYFDVTHLLTYFLIIDYLAGKDQLAKNIIWRVWNGLKWWAGFYDGDTWEAIRNDAFIVYLYNITRDSYDSERAKYAFEGHSSWLWCLVLANLEDELKQCAVALRNKLTNQKMLDEFIGTMIGNWSARQYNKSGKLKYIDTIDNMNYVYTLTGSREEHIRQFISDRARLLDARYGAGEYNGDVVTFTVVREASDTPSSLTLKSGDLYYFGYKLNGIWLQGPSKADLDEQLTLNFTQRLATNDPLMLGGASCIKELDFTNMGSQLNGTVNLSLCTMLSKLVMPATVGVANAPIIFGETSKLQYIDITGQTGVHSGTAGVFDVSKHTRLTTLLAGGTALTTVKIAEGAPATTVVLPATLTTLTLRYLPNLTHSGLTLQNAASVRALNFAECPNLDWRILLQQCQNIDHVRIEGMSGRVRSSVLRPFMSGYMGLTATGSEQTYPALIGTVQLIDVVDDFAAMQTFFERCGLTVIESQYSEYIFSDEETDPSNITNEDNQTGYDYRVGAESTTEHPNGYFHSGHVELIHDRCVPVSGYINPDTHKMHVEPLSKANYALKADGTAADITGSSSILLRDAFLYVPKYHYKGVNDYKNARKHLFLSNLKTVPDSTATVTNRLQLSDVTKLANSVPLNTRHNVGDTMNEQLLYTSSALDTYKVDVSGGMKQVRFPGYHDSIDGVACVLFVGINNKVLQVFNFQMQDIVVNGAIVNPADFDNNIGDYIFLPIPENAKYLYFACTKESAETEPEIILTDSNEIEAIEPDWVEHKAELIGIYQGWAEGLSGASGGIATGGLRSISGKVVIRGNGTSTTNTSWQYDSVGNPTGLPSTKLNGTAQDFFNLARYRTRQSGVINGEYTTVPFETSKDMANLLMAWFGTRDIETIVGRGSSAGETTGLRNNIGMGDSAYPAQNQHNKMWGLECWTASTYEWTDKGCFNAPSFAQFLKDKRPENITTYPIDYYYNILQQDGNERRVKAATLNAATCAARVRFGRRCEIVVSSYTGEATYAMCYAAYQSSNGSRGRVLGRSYSGANAYAGVAYSSSYYASASSYANYGGRLCFFGEIENESELEAAA